MMLHPHHQHDCHKRGMQFTSATLSWIIRIVFHEQRSAVALSSLLFAHWSAFCCSQQTSSEMSINEARWAFPCTHSHSMCTFRLCTKHFSEASLKMLVVCYPSDSALAAKTKKICCWSDKRRHIKKANGLFTLITYRDTEPFTSLHFFHRSWVNPSLVNYKKKTKEHKVTAIKVSGSASRSCSSGHWSRNNCLQK